jgi:hypothetical protein
MGTVRAAAALEPKAVVAQMMVRAHRVLEPPMKGSLAVRTTHLVLVMAALGSK